MRITKAQGDLDPIHEAAERFKRETAKHQMTVLHDNGLYRHLRFKAAGTSFYWFDLVTWPGNLNINGDCGTFVFSRLEDMFEFFRGSGSSCDYGINPSYWAEKVRGETSVKSYSEDLFCHLVIEYFTDAVKNGGVPRGTGKALRTEVLESEEINYEDGARRVLEAFEHGPSSITQECTCGARTTVAAQGRALTWRLKHPAPEHLVAEIERERVEPFRFHGTGEWDLRDWDWTYLWCCHAIVWGIRQYDEARKRVVA